MQKIKDFFENHFVDIICITAFVFFVLGVWCLYTANRSANEYSDVHNTVQQVKADNRTARQQINSAQSEIGKAEIKLSDGIKRTDRITKSVTDVKKRVDGNAGIARECEGIIKAGRNDLSEARSILAEIDERNKTNGAQTSRT